VSARGVRLLLGLLAALLLLPPAAMASGGGRSQDAESAGDASGPVVLVGIGALAWSDVDESTPTLFALAGTDAAASLTVRSVRRTTCLVDGWLTVSAGQRAVDAERAWCRPVPRPVLEDGVVSAGDWERMVAEQDAYGYAPRMGLLGDTLAAERRCATAVGPGAALALAQADGTVDRYLPSVVQVDGAVVAQCPVTVVDLGWVPRREEEGQRREQAALIDQQLAALVDVLPSDATLLVVGVSDSGPTVRAALLPDENSGEPSTQLPDPNAEAPVISDDEVFPFPPPGLRLAAATGTDLGGTPYGPEWLSSASTRWTGMVQLTDVTPTLLAYAGVDPPPGLVGRPWRQAGPHPGSAEETVEELVGADAAAQVFRTQSGVFFQGVGAVELIFAVVALMLLSRTVEAARRRRLLRATVVGALLFASFPVASFLANTVRWWLTERPTLVLWLAIGAWGALVTAFAVLGPWRRRVYGPPGAVAGVTVGVLAVDVLTGANLQHSSLLGLSPLVAGRFYGLGNIPFSIWAACVLVLCGAVAQWMLDTGRSRRIAALAVLGLGGLTVVLTGTAGADFGGMLALGPAVAVLAFGVGAWRASVTRVLVVTAVSVAVVAAVSVLDWRGPAAERSHLGDFVQSVMDGEAVTIVVRKADAAIGTLARGPYGWLAVVALVAVVLMLRDPRRMRAEGVLDAFERWPLLRPTIWSCVTVAVVGFAVNDSGIIIPALVLTVGIPLVVAAVADSRLRSSQEAAEPPPYEPISAGGARE
jgi:hypothetical protein